jgi:uncharacterized protein (TIGR02145 family)
LICGDSVSAGLSDDDWESATFGACTIDNNNNANNESGFTALPAGQRSWYGPFNDPGTYGYWWTASEGFASGSWGRSMVNGENKVVRYNYTREAGFSVRCIKN